MLEMVRVKLNDTKHSKVQNLFKWIIRIPFGYCNSNFEREKEKKDQERRRKVEYYFYGFAFSLGKNVILSNADIFKTKGDMKKFLCIKIINQNSG